MAKTYTDLFADIKLQLNRNDLDANIPSFIDLGERKVYRDLRCSEMEKEDLNNTLTGTTPQLAVPADYLEGSRFWEDSYGNLITMIPMARMRKLRFYYPDGVGGSKYWSGHQVLYVARDVDNFHFWPAVSVDVSFVYFAKPDAITASNPTNTVIDVAYDALLFAAVSEGFDFIKEYDVAKVWLQKAMAVVTQLNEERKRQDKGGSTQVMGSPYAV